METNWVGWSLVRLGWALSGKERRRWEKGLGSRVRVLVLAGHLWKKLLQEVYDLGHVTSRTRGLLGRGEAWVGGME